MKKILLSLCLVLLFNTSIFAKMNTRVRDCNNIAEGYIITSYLIRTNPNWETSIRFADFSEKDEKLLLDFFEQFDRRFSFIDIYNRCMKMSDKQIYKQLKKMTYAISFATRFYEEKKDY